MQQHECKQMHGWDHDCFLKLYLNIHKHGNIINGDSKIIEVGSPIVQGAKEELTRSFTLMRIFL